jgi:hypothetical protein
MQDISKPEALEDLKRRMQTAAELLIAARNSAKNHGVDIINLDFVLEKLYEYCLRVDLNLKKIC